MAGWARFRPRDSGHTQMIRPRHRPLDDLISYYHYAQYSGEPIDAQDVEAPTLRVEAVAGERTHVEFGFEAWEVFSR